MINVNVKKLHSLTGHSDCVYALQQGNAAHLFFSAAGDGMKFFDVDVDHLIA